MRKPTTSLIILSLLICLMSCEGFKVLSIHNASRSTATITVRPGIENPAGRPLNSYTPDQLPDSTRVILLPDSSLTLLSFFTGLMFNAKLKERDLRTDYLRIETEKDTVVANSKKEIIELLYGKRVDHINNKGRNFLNLSITDK